MSLKVIITGATGMVGEGVLVECLRNPAVVEVLVVNRRPVGISHAKLREVLPENFFDLSAIEAELTGYDACYFCLGVSSVGLKPDEYQHLTYDLTLNFANTLARQNPKMTFCYVTGLGTDSHETGSSHWARVKGATENALLKLFDNSYMFRPGFMKAMPKQKNVKTLYRLFMWLYWPGRVLIPSYFCTLEQVALAMIRVSLKPYPKRVLEVADIIQAAKRDRPVNSLRQ